MHAPEIIEQIKKAHGCNSDYAVAKLLGVQQSTLSHYRNRGGNMDVATAFRAAELLDMDPALLIAEMELKRAKTSAARETLSRYIKSASALILVAFMAGGLLVNDATAGLQSIHYANLTAWIAALSTAAYFTLCRLAHTGQRGMVSLLSSQ